MQRKDIKEEDKWDLTKYFKNQKEYDSMYEKTKELVNKMVAMKGHIYDNLYDFYELDSEISKNEETLYVYSYLMYYEDTNNSKGADLKNRADYLDEWISEQVSFVRSELLSKSYAYVKKLIKQDKRLEKYAFSIEKLFRYKKHTLSEREEKIISLASNAFGTGDNAFSSLDNSDAKFGTININGEDIELNHSNYIKLVSDKDRNIREKVFKQYYKFFIDHKNTIAEMYKGQVKEDIFSSKVRKFSSPLEQSLFSDDISEDVYRNLIKTIHDNMKPMYEYMDFRKKYLGLDKLHMYDVYVDLIDGETRKFTFDEAKDIVLDAVKPLGDKYVNDLSKAFADRWIDKYPNDGKRSGAYQWGSYGVTPYVSMNFEGTEDSVSTLGHELGHAMHSYYSDNNQPYHYAQYPIFLAEIASTVNEVLINDYMIKHASNTQEKLLYVTSLLDKIRTTIYRQTMFAEFELIIHEEALKGIPLTTDYLADTYMNLNKLYFGPSVISDEEIKYEWSRIPHFYTPFYVYKYATGLASALAIASDILNGKKGAQEKYLEFLKSGGSKYPLDTLKACGVDMTTSEPIKKAVKIFEDNLNLARELVKKVK